MKKRVKVIGVSEEQIQIAVIQHLKLRGNPRAYWFHVPNGGSRNVIEASKLKAMGVRAGVADIVVVIDGRAHFLELKSRKGRPSKDQLIARDLVELAGGVYEIAHGLDEALATLTRWGAFLIAKFGPRGSVGARV